MKIKIFLIIFLLISICFLFYKPNTTHKTLHLNKYNVILILKYYDIKYPDIVLSQSLIESGNFSSKLCYKYHNLFGMNVPSKRLTTAINNSGYAKYNNWIESIGDYKLYQEYIITNNCITSRKEYLQYLRKNYAESPNYLK